MRTRLPAAHIVERLVWAGLLLSVLPVNAYAVPGAGEVGAGNRSFKEGEYRKALESYEKASGMNPSEPAIDYDLGAAYYKVGDFDKAVENFQKSLLTDDDRLRQDARYNLANALFKSGIAREEVDIGRAISGLEQALGEYAKVIAVEPKDADAKANQELVRRELERLKKKQQEMKQDQQDSSSSQKDGQQGSKGQDQPGGSKEKPDRTKEDKKQDGSDRSAGGKDKPDQGNGSKDDQKRGRNEVPGDKDGKDSRSGPRQEDKSPQGADRKSPRPEGEPGKDKPGSDKAGQQKAPTAGQSMDGKVLSQEEARAILDDFDQNEQPKGLLNFLREKREGRPVEKDW